MSLERVNPAELAPPKGFSHAVTGRGTVVFLAGQTALDSAGKIIGAGITAQFEQALGNLLAALRAAGGEPGMLASLTVYATDIADYRAHAAQLGRVWRRLADMSPQKRLYSADEVSALVLFLCTEAAAGINGQALNVDGGTVV